MSARVRVLGLAFLIFCTDFAVLARQTLAPFSSDVTYTAYGETHTGKIYSDGHTIRIESEGRVPAQEKITFIRLDSGLVQVMIPELKAYSEYPYGAPTDAEFIRYLSDAHVESEPLGAELIDGQECDKVLVTANHKDHVYSSIEWRSRELHGFVLTSQDTREQWSTEYRNVHLGSQPNSIFQLPAGYRPIVYSQDWTAAVRRMDIAASIVEKISIAREEGLRVVGEDGTVVAENSPPTRLFFVRIIDPITGSDVFVGPHVYTGRG